MRFYVVAVFSAAAVVGAHLIAHGSVHCRCFRRCRRCRRFYFAVLVSSSASTSEWSANSSQRLQKNLSIIHGIY